MGVHEATWDKEGTARAEDSIYIYGKGNENHQSGTGYFVQHRRGSAVKRVQFVHVGMTYSFVGSLVQYHGFECASTKSGEK